MVSKPKPKPKAKPAKIVKIQPAPAVLNKLAKPEKPKPKPKPASLAEYDPTKPLAQSVLSSIQSQIAASWRVKDDIIDNSLRGATRLRTVVDSQRCS